MEEDDIVGCWTDESSNFEAENVGVFDGVGGVSPLGISKVCKGLDVARAAVPIVVVELEASVWGQCEFTTFEHGEANN